MMRPETLRSYLNRAERHAVRGRETINRQRKLISRLREKGQDSTLAESILRTMIETQELHEDTVRKLSMELNGELGASVPVEPPRAAGAIPNEGNYLLRSLSNEDLALLQPCLKSVVLRFRQRLQAANRQMQTVHFPNSGMVSIVTVSRHGRRQALGGLVGREGMTGLPIAFESDRSPFEIEVEVEGHAHSISTDDLARAMESSASLHGVVTRYLHIIWVQLAYSALANAEGTIVERLARLLLMAQDRLETGEIPLTHEQLATMMAVRRAGVTTALRTLEASGVVAKERGAITITNRAGLQRQANNLY